MRGSLRFALAAGAALPLAGCEGWQSALDAGGPHAGELSDLIWQFTYVCAAVWALVLLALLVALVRRRAERPDPLATDPGRERRTMGIIGALVGVTAAIVVALTLLSFFSQRSLFAKQDPAVTIRVTGHQWWWEFRYEDGPPSEWFTTANEIHVPVGRPVTLKLETPDVNHSFWVPSLAGKMDLIKGQLNELQFVAARPGTYRGQCAEFCGLQHAYMGVLVTAEPASGFERWRAGQIAPAADPDTPERQKGREVMLSNPCVMCHTVRGTPAAGKVGPDLTHLASRQYLAAATVPLTRGRLGAWVVDPHGTKPGVNMPLVKLEPDELDPLLSYLMGLK